MSRFIIRPSKRILKARRPPWKKTRTYKRQFALAQAMGKAVKVNLITGLTKFKTKINPEKIYHAYMSGDWHKVYETIPWHELPGDMSDVIDPLEGTMSDSIGIAREGLPSPIDDRLRFDTKNPLVRGYMTERTGNLVVGIEHDTKAFIADAISRQFDQALTPRKVADIIKPSIGLYPGQVTALMNYQNGLEAKDLPQAQIQRQVAEYHDRLLDNRAACIARTETRFATNHAELSVWNAAADQGLIDRESATKIWIVDGNPCDVCQDMDGVEVSLNEPWVLEYPDGSVKNVMVPTESHPNCMCGMELQMGKVADDDDNAPEPDDNADGDQTGEES